MKEFLKPFFDKVPCTIVQNVFKFIHVLFLYDLVLVFVRIGI